MRERLKYLRKEKLGLTMEEFGSRLGLSKMAISRAESGKSNLSEVAIKSICREFGVNEEWLRTGTGPMEVPEPTDELDAIGKKYGLSARSLAFIKEFAELKEDEQEVVLKYVENVARSLKAAQLHADLDRELEEQEAPEAKSTGSDFMRA